MSLAEQALSNRDYSVVLAPMTVYCYKCNAYIRKGELAHRYDAATFTHEGCPTLPMKTYAPHKYGGN